MFWKFKKYQFKDFSDNTIVLHFLNLFLVSNIFPLLDEKYENKNYVLYLDKFLFYS